MKVEVQLLFEKGKALPSPMRKTMRKYAGFLNVKEVRDSMLARAHIAANLLGNDAEPMLPQLHDAVLLYANGGQMRIRGFELHEGTQYGQAWEVKVLPC